MRVFYIIHPSEPPLLGWLNLLRFLANPNQKFITHLTVRGPYGQRYNLKSASDQIQGHILNVNGVDGFFGPGQATAILRLAPDSKLYQVWHKPDYPDFNPHISLCDGLSEKFTKSVIEACAQVRPFAFHSSPLFPLVTKPANEEFSLAKSVDVRLLRQVLGDAYDIEAVRQADERTRLEWLARVVQSQPP